MGHAALLVIGAAVIALAVSALPTRGEVPADLLDDVVEDLALRTGVDVSQIREVRSEVVVWNDDTLGCPEAVPEGDRGPTDGYWIVLQLGASEFDYRATSDRAFYLCRWGVP